MELGNNLRTIRTRLGLSQQALAKRAGISRNFIAQIERGESVPTISTVSRVAGGLGVSVGELLGEERPMSSAVDTVPVPLIADRIAAGPPLLMADQVERYEHLPYRLLRDLGVDPRQPVLVRLGPDQDSMTDTIAPGSTLLIDRSPIRDVTPKGIYAVRDPDGDSGCTVKRLVLDAAERVLILLADNPAYLPRAVRLKSGQALADLVIGRVVWWMPPAGRA